MAVCLLRALLITFFFIGVAIAIAALPVHAAAISFFLFFDPLSLAPRLPSSWELINISNDTHAIHLHQSEFEVSRTEGQAARAAAGAGRRRWDTGPVWSGRRGCTQRRADQRARGRPLQISRRCGIGDGRRESAGAGCGHGAGHCGRGFGHRECAHCQRDLRTFPS